jgi:hypothetical protein
MNNIVSNCDEMNVVTLDIGIYHLAYVYVTLSQDQFMWKITDIHEVKLLDITSFNCDRDTCELYHDKTMSDYLRHFFVNKRLMFETSTNILVERQPIGGLIVIQELILNEYRDKVRLVHPRSVHTFLGISHFVKLYGKELAYMKRKEWTTIFVEHILRHWNISLASFERKHDICDSFAQLCYYICTMNKNERKGRSKYFLGEDTFTLFIQEAIRYTHTILWPLIAIGTIFETKEEVDE